MRAPGGGACYVLEDGEGRGVLLATVGGLRAALVRRMTGAAEGGPSKRVDYRAVVRRVRWRAVYSPFEANWAYLENVRAMFPDTYQRLIRRWRCHWVGVDRDAAHPRFKASDDPGKESGRVFGPIREGKAARQLVERLEDLFDLCRYHDVLVQSPAGTACAYKEMGKCAAPCDGSIGMDVYRNQVDAAIGFLAGPREGWVAEVEARMAAAAASLAFEEAQRFKSMLERAGAMDGPGLAHVAALERFKFLCLQRGQRKGRPRAFVITPGRIRFLGEMLVKQMDQQIDWLLGQVGRIAGEALPRLDRAACERMALVSWHLFRGEREAGEFLRIDDGLDVEMVAAAVARINEKPTDEGAGQDASANAMSSEEDAGAG